MISWNSLALLAQEAAEKAAPEAGNAPPTLPGLLVFAIPVIVVWYVMLIRPQNKERAQRQDMLNDLKKNDSVATIGGILGTVSHISEDGKEVTLRIEDNAHLRIRRDAISEIRNAKTSDS